MVRVAATRLDGLTIALEAVEVASAARRDAVVERVTLGPEADSGLLAAARALRPEPARVRGRTRRIAGWTLLGVGAVSAGLSLWALADSSDAEHEFDRHLDAQGNVVGLTPAAAHAPRDRARSGRLIGASGAALAAVAVAGGVGLLLWPRSQERSLAVAPLPQRGASAVVTQRF